MPRRPPPPPPSRSRHLPAARQRGAAGRVVSTPVALRHPPPVGPEPPGVGQPGAALLGPGEEARPAEDRMLAPEPDQVDHEPAQLLIGVLPVEPRDLVVLAPRVVVAALRAP